MASNPYRIQNVEATNGDTYEVIKLGEVPPFVGEEYDHNDANQVEKFINDCKKVVRQSFEYREFVKYCRENMDMNHCAFLGNVTNIESNKIKIHIHHTPITLYEIIAVIYYKRVFYGESLEIEDVAKEVMYVHYCGLIGLIPLSETAHELVHNEFLFVPNNWVFGRYNYFITIYEPWVNTVPGLREKIDRLDEYSKFYDKEANEGILKAHRIRIGDFEETILPKLADIERELQGRMEALKENGYSTEPSPFVTFVDRNNLPYNK